MGDAGGGARAWRWTPVSRKRSLNGADCELGRPDAVLCGTVRGFVVTLPAFFADVSYLPQKGATAYDQALRAACTHGHVEVVVLLLGVLVAGRAETPRSPPGLPLPLLLNTALGHAAKCGDEVVVELLLQVRTNANGGIRSSILRGTLL